MIEITRTPSRRTLLAFALGLPLFFGSIGAFRWNAGATSVAVAFWAAGGVLSAVALLVPRARRSLYIGWMAACYPVAWTVSQALLFVVYFLVATPMALVLRAVGRDPMQRKFDKTAASYWVVRSPRIDGTRYFRQF